MIPEITYIIIIVILAIVVGVMFLRKPPSPISDIRYTLGQLHENQNLTMQMLEQRLGDQNQALMEGLHLSQNSMQKQFELTQRIVKDVTGQLTELGETNKQIVGFASQLQSLEKVLKNPKQRGILGEYLLETVLKNVLPPAAFQMQYKFEDGQIVDAVVITNNQLIPIDAKFSLENYNRLASAETEMERNVAEKLFQNDLKKRIDETSKYIRPETKTYDFAFMFIPADGLYYDILSHRVGALKGAQIGIIEYAFEKRVILVSPTTLFAYLQTVLQGLRALKIEESAQLIQQNVTKLQKHIETYQINLAKLGTHLSHAVSSYNSSTAEFTKISKDVVRISKEGEPSEFTAIAGPQ